MVLVKRYFKENMGIIIAFFILCTLLSFHPITRDSFFTQQNIFNVLRQISTNLFLACGMTMVIIPGGIDLSVGSVIALSGVVSVVVGGTSMSGGSGKIGGTIIGGLIIGVLNNGLNLLNVSSFWQFVVKGVVILLAVFIDYVRTKGK